jgi:hypothetical protein
MLYQWSHAGCGGNPPQAEIVKLRRTDHGLCRWAYASKDVPVSPAMQATLGPMPDRLACE